MNKQKNRRDSLDKKLNSYKFLYLTKGKIIKKFNCLYMNKLKRNKFNANKLPCNSKKFKKHH